jgi:hypothetical protein
MGVPKSSLECKVVVFSQFAPCEPLPLVESEYKRRTRKWPQKRKNLISGEFGQKPPIRLVSQFGATGDFKPLGNLGGM